MGYEVSDEPTGERRRVVGLNGNSSMCIAAILIFVIIPDARASNTQLWEAQTGGFKGIDIAQYICAIVLFCAFLSGWFAGALCDNICARMFTPPQAAAPQRPPKRAKMVYSCVGSQSQVTYLRNRSTPRFPVLPESVQGL